MASTMDAYRSGDLRVARAVSHYDECTLGLCIQSLEMMDAKFTAAFIASGLTPMCNSFNACLDFAIEEGVDILFHTASDVIVEPFALVRLLEVMNITEHYLAIAKGYDPMFGYGASVGIWIWNMHVLESNYRFRDVFKQDMDLCDRIETATGKSRVYTPSDLQMGYHHPIWTAKDIYKKILYSFQKYGIRRKQDIQNFVEKGLLLNPNNKVLLAGKKALVRAEAEKLPTGSKDSAVLEIAFAEDSADLHLDGSEYYVKHKAFRPYAMRVMDSFAHCVCVDDD